MPPTLPPELILRILTLAADEARVGASAFTPVDPFLRHLALISKDWRQFGQAQLLRGVNLHFDDLGIGSPPQMSKRGYSLICALWTTPGLGSAVARLTVEGTCMFGAYRWGDLLGLCGSLACLACSNTYLNVGLLASCQGLTELVLERVDFAWPPTVTLPKLLKLKVSNCFATGARLAALGPASFPSLEVLVIVDSAKFGCPALVATPSLRALVISTSLQIDDLPPLYPRSILFDLSMSSLDPHSEWRCRAPLAVHLRSAFPAHFGPLAELVMQGDRAVHNLRTLYLGRLPHDGDAVWAADASRLATVARAKGIGIVTEDTLESSKFGFDHFLEHGQSFQ